VILGDIEFHAGPLECIDPHDRARCRTSKARSRRPAG
jgi:hypothetical protein